MDRWLIAFCAWLEQTPPSQIIQSAGWIVPTVQTIHILAIAAVMSSVLMIVVRLFGILWRDQSLSRVLARFLPVVLWSLLILLTTGVVMIVGEPGRALRNPVFQLKMTLLLTTLIVTFVLTRFTRGVVFGDVGQRSHAASQSVAVVWLLLWVGIVFSGRWIAYWM